MSTGAIVAVTLELATRGDTASRRPGGIPMLRMFMTCDLEAHPRVGTEKRCDNESTPPQDGRFPPAQDWPLLPAQ